MKIISESKRKNIKMVVYQNTDEHGKKCSITRHVPLDETKPAYRRQFGKRHL